MNTIIKNQLTLYQKLISIFPKTRKIEGRDKKSITTMHFASNKKIWFAKEEKYNKSYYFFGIKKNRLTHINNAVLIIDINREHEYDADSIGWIDKNPKGIKLLLNLDVLNKKYPNIIYDDFKSYHVKSGQIIRNYIDLGYIENDDFIKNLERIINNSITPKTQGDNYFCEICEKNKSNGKLDSRLTKLTKIKPELCGSCIEKIVLCEFYKKIESLLINNETKTLKITREKYANEEEFDFGIKLLEKYKILKYVGIKKLFFTIDKNNPILKKYLKYVNKDDYLLDLIFGQKIIPYKDKQIKMNLFINALKSGKNENEALRVAKLNSNDVEKWYNLGKNGDSNYKTFYINYDEFKIPKKEMNTIIQILRNSDLENALKKANVNFTTAKKWFNFGKNHKKGYEYFYRECRKLLPDGFIIKTDKELIGEFIQLRNDGKSNEQAIKQLNISNEKISMWINKAKTGDKKYDDFYDIYNDSEKQSCEVCGRKINTINEKKICKRCEKKQFASKIVLKLLNHFECEKYFKKEELKIANLNTLQIKEYLWTLKEFNLITEKNNKYKLKNLSFLKDFIKSSGLDSENITIETNNEELYKTCIQCGKTLLIKSNFKNNEDICNDCKKLKTQATYLAELINYVNFDISFSEDDLTQYYDNPLTLQAKLWALVDNDLVKKNLDNNTYTLADSKTIKDFLKKYADIEIKDKTSQNIKDDGIFTLLPDEIEKELHKHSKSNKTGFAWVNHVGNNYIYSRTSKGNQIQIKNKDIKKLYDDVKKQGLIWGVRDIEKAKNTVKNQELKNNAPDIENIKNTDKSQKPKIDSGIYAPLPEKYLNKFNGENKTGIAWVNENGKAFMYSRTTNGNLISIRENSIEELYLKAKSKNQIWGIRDYYKASKYIDIPEELIPKTPEEEKPKKSNVKTGIYKPLPKKYITQNLIKNSTTGIAWVDKINGRWIYNYQNNNLIIRLSDNDIHNLYKKVIENNGLWGIIDIDLAEPIIEYGNYDKKVKVKSNVNVNYISNVKSKITIIINGRIKNNQLIYILSELKTFEKNFKRIITTSINNEVDLFIEIEINKNLKKSFEKTINKLGWCINGS